ncbi:cobalamin biosynthesis protein [Paraburkholderia sp.]|jgi:cobalamin biosynthesis protein CbiG|uniref:cobalamin biosynthesis protein n=1 Tax=Paraburkholderia sp. TaxID=1926495 RepID=UPI002F41A373
MKHLSVGIGCKLNTSADHIEAAVRGALGAHAFDEIACIATLDIKAREPGLIEFCTRHAVSLQVFSRAEIEAVSDLPTPSDAARRHLGIEGVCEPCALLATPGGRLIVRKTAWQGVTVAIATSLDAPASESESTSRDTL